MMDYRLRRLEAFLPEASRTLLRRAWGLDGNPEYRIAGHLCDPTMIAIDAGAATGGFAAVLAGTSRYCEAFEANPDNWPLLEENLSGKNVRIHRCALSDIDGQVALRIPLLQGIDVPPLSTVAPENALGGSDVRTVTVPSRRLDDLDLPPVGFMKIDVEGHELAVLHGGRVLLDRDRPNLMVEAEDRHRPRAITDLVAELSNLGYVAYFLLGRRLKPIAEFRPSIHQSSDSVSLTEILPGRVYVNNFVFVTRPQAVEALLGRRL
jgi:FkbM family methyltransferase